MTDIEHIVESIHAATSAGTVFPWSTMTDTQRDPWRAMARAAMYAQTDERSLATQIAEMHYRRTEWSGCAGSNWDNLPPDEQAKRVETARKWIGTINVAGLSIVRPA